MLKLCTSLVLTVRLERVTGAVQTSGWRRLLGGGALILLSCAASADDVVEQVYDWLERMNQAVLTLDYEGRFVYQHGDHLEALYIKHTSRAGVEHERLISLNGSRRQVVRNSESVSCLLPTQQTIDIGRPASRRRLAPFSPIRPMQLTDHYHFEMGNMSRVAGRVTQDVIIRPKDRLRFGYQLSLDDEYALPLSTAMIDVDNTKVSRIMFTHLNIGELRDPVAHSEPMLDGALEPDQSRSSAQPRKRLMGASAWTFGQLPAGFMLDVHRRQARAGSLHPTDHFVFSDGLAKVSVYVEPSGPNDIKGATDAGPMNAYGRSLNSHHVTAVGEVPPLTVRMFSEAIKAAGSGQ